MKAFFTDRGFEATVACQQVLGGHGYVKDYGLEQFVRNARIGQIYEGANGIQAVDLMHRKLNANGARPRRHFVFAIRSFLESNSQTTQLNEILPPLSQALNRLEKTFEWMDQPQISNPSQRDAGAYDLLTALGIVYLAWIWAEIAVVVTAPTSCTHASETQRLRKFQLAKLWMQRQLPLVDAFCARIESGNESLLALADEMV